MFKSCILRQFTPLSCFTRKANSLRRRFTSYHACQDTFRTPIQPSILVAVSKFPIVDKISQNVKLEGECK